MKLPVQQNQQYNECKAENGRGRGHKKEKDSLIEDLLWFKPLHPRMWPYLEVEVL